jgi:hypothetical protein
MSHREGEVNEERFACRLLLLHECDGPVGEFIVDLCTHLWGEGFHAFEGATHLLLHDPRSLFDHCALRHIQGVGHRDQRDCHSVVPRGVRWDTIKFIETVRGWQALGVFAQVPLSEDCRRVASVLEELAHRVRFSRKRI